MPTRSSRSKSSSRGKPKKASRSKAKPKPKPKPKPPPKPIDLSGGGYVLDVPYEVRQVATHLGAKWDPARGMHVYAGTALPPLLEAFRPAPFSWAARLHEDATGGRAVDVPPAADIVLRDHQVEAVESITAVRKAGLPGFLLADEVGLGKTLATLGAIHEMPASKRDVLVLAPKSVMPGWRKSIEAMGTGGRRWTVLNYDSIKKLLTTPPSATTAKTKSTRNKRVAMNGKPIVDWNIVVLDEAHLLRNPTSQRSHAVRTLTRDAFTFFLSATAGQDPLELVYLARLLASVTGVPVQDLEEFQHWCTDIGISITRGDYGRLLWDNNPDDIALVNKLLFGQWKPGQPAAGLRRVPTDIAGWPEQQRIPHPLDLIGETRRLYDEAWTEFRAQMDLAQRGKDPTNGLAAQTRFRQKASLLRVPATADHVLTLLEAGRQVFVSCQWLESVDALAEMLGGKTAGGRKVRVATLHGGMSSAEREVNREAFQDGDANVIVSTVVEGINLQAGESGHDNNTPRATVLHDIRYSAIQCRQVEGRTHRDGQNAVAYWCYATDTVEEKIVLKAVERMETMGDLQGDDTSSVAELEELLISYATRDDAGLAA